MGFCFPICVLELWQVASRPARQIYLRADTSAELLINAKQVTLQKRRMRLDACGNWAKNSSCADVTEHRARSVSLGARVEQRSCSRRILGRNKDAKSNEPRLLRFLKR
jgi:hypothetical protein